MSYYDKYLKYKNKYLELKNQVGGVEEKVLILCHPRIVTGSFNPLTLNNHFYGLKIKEGEPPLFEQLFSEYNLQGIPKFETVDIRKPPLAEDIIQFNLKPENLNATYIEDAFGDEFINKHIGEYYLVMVPDCDGRWLIEQRNYPVNKEILLKLCLDLTKMVKKNGFIQFGKFFKGCDHPPPPFLTDLDNLLKQNNFDTKIKCVYGADWCLIAHKL